MKKFLLKIFKPMLKKIVLGLLEKEQEPVINIIMKKIVIDGMSGEVQEHMANEIYDALQAYAKEKLEKALT